MELMYINSEESTIIGDGAMCAKGYFTLEYIPRRNGGRWYIDVS